MQKINYQDLGKINYKEAFSIQERLFEENIRIKLNNRKNEGEGQEAVTNHLLFCEHPHVITLGKSGEIDNLLLSEKYLAQRGIEFHYTNRGGDITYHGPGQIVGYPILDLEGFKLDIHTYINNIEEVMIRLLKEYGIVSGRAKGMTGVWLDVGTPKERKICAIGVKASRYITMHGFAFNVNTSLEYFENIVPCGISGKGVTSLQKELNQEMDFELVKQKVRHYFEEVFGCEIVEL